MQKLCGADPPYLIAASRDVSAMLFAGATPKEVLGSRLQWLRRCEGSTDELGRPALNRCLLRQGQRFPAASSNHPKEVNRDLPEVR